MSKLLAQGGYGCVFHPEIQCSGKSGSNKTVSKLQKRNHASINEYKIGKLISNIKNYDNYFLPATGSCPVELSNINNNIIKRCEVINQKYSYTLMSFPFVENIGFIDFFTTTKNPEFYLIEMYERLVQGIQLLNNNNIIHHDIKEDNILIQSNNNMPIIIDYGISIHMKDLNKLGYENAFYIYAPDYYPWCIEQHIICYVVQQRLNLHNYTVISQVELYSIINAYTTSTFFMVFSNTFIDKYNKALKHSLSRFINKTPQYILDTLIKDYSSWDLVALSIMFIKLIKLVYENKALPEIIVNLFKIILLNISPNRKNRLSHTITLENIKRLKHLNASKQIYYGKK